MLEPKKRAENEALFACSNVNFDASKKEFTFVDSVISRNDLAVT
jgi:hypothetical protein